MMTKLTSAPIYIVTDCEFDGPRPGHNSMLSFASLAVTASGQIFGEFEAVLDRLDGAKTDPITDDFWKEFPEAYLAATQNSEPPGLVMKRFVEWVRHFPGDCVFAAHPLALDGPWIDFYLQRFTGEFLLEGPWKPDRLFKGAPLCLVSFAAGRLGKSMIDYGGYAAEWLGNQKHTHCAIDDARGYANLLVYLMKRGAHFV